jgi:hypothetical protein
MRSLASARLNRADCHFPLPLSLRCHARRNHSQRILPRSILHRALSPTHLVFQGRSTGQAITHLHIAVLDELTCSQLNVIPTVGFSDPILSYFSALKLNFDADRMAKEGYEKVIYIFLNRLLVRAELTMSIFS